MAARKRSAAPAVRFLLAVLGALAVLAAAAALALNRWYPEHLLRRPQLALKALLGEEMLLRDYDPRPRLTVPAHPIERARYPVINIHAHFRRWQQAWTPEDLIGFMDACNIGWLVDLDGGLGKSLREEIAAYADRYPGRFIHFATFGFKDELETPEAFAEKVRRLEEAKTLGARGIKVWKNLGLRTRDGQGRLVPIDDPRVDALWAKAGELGLPILIHVADPLANFDPLDRHNERYEFLTAERKLSYQGPSAPRPEALLEQFERAVARHPKTTFILAHLGNRTDDLAAAGAMLDRHPNLFMDISARVQELGRQPHTTRAFMIRYQDRLVFGTDGNPDAGEYRTHFRFLETADEYFEYPYRALFNYGRWKIYGVDLPDDVLRKLYHDNAAALLGLPRVGEREDSR
jgi:predicted TIM-barrel fold metal-dependent hydrolase